MTELFHSASQWIWLDCQWLPNRYMEAAVDFNAAESSAYSLHISVEGQFVAFINGVRVPSTQYADFPSAKSVQCPEVTALVRPGRNRLSIQCWYPGEDSFGYRREAPGLRFELLRDGQVLCASGADTPVRPIAAYVDGPVPAITPQLGFGFTRRIAQEAPFQPAVCVDKPAQCVPRPIRELCVDPCLPAIIVAQGAFQEAGGRDVGERMQFAGLFWQDLRTMTGQASPALPSESGLHFETASGDGIFLLLDLGDLYEGYLALDMVCPQDAIVDVGFGEHLQDLRVRTSVGSRCFAVTCTAGPARTQFIHWFRRLGCRYLQLFIHSRSATIHEAGVLPARYPVDERPQLHLDDPLHDRIAQVCRRTLLSCMHEHYEDCPWREQALYAFDSRSQMLAGYYAFGEFDFPRENLRLLALSQREDGLLELCAPARAPITIPAFSLSFIVALEEYCRYSGDLDFCREMLPVAERILDVLDRQTQNSLAWRMQEPQYWNFYEWSPGLDGESRTAVPPRAEAGLQLFGLVALQRMDSLRRMLGIPQRESEQALHQALAAGLEQFWDDDAQAYASVLCDGRRSHYAELIQALALLSGACPAERAVILRDGLLHGRWSPITLSHSLLKYEALLQDPALGKAVFDEIGRRWGAMLYQGATTFWEVDEGAPAFDRAGSLCHGWSAIPYYLYCAYGLGVRPERPGVWQLTDRRDGLSMSAALCTPEGCFDVCAGSVGPVTMQRR